MAPKPETIKKRMEARVKNASKTHRVTEAHFDPDTGAGVLVAHNEAGNLVALFFDPKVSRFFEEEPLTSHDRVNLGKVLKKRQADKLAAEWAPHDLKIGEIFYLQSGATVSRHSFYKITAIPTPCQIEAVEVPVKVTWGTLAHGSVVPDLDAPIPPNAKRGVLDIRMDKYGPSLRGESRRRTGLSGGRWTGEPLSNYED